MAFKENREFQICCGAGGGVKAGDPDLAGIIAHEKLDKTHKLGADILTSTCPFCKRNMEDARVAAGSSIDVCDIIELVDRMMIHTTIPITTPGEYRSLTDSNDR